MAKWIGRRKKDTEEARRAISEALAREYLGRMPDGEPEEAPQAHSAPPEDALLSPAEPAAAPEGARTASDRGEPIAADEPQPAPAAPQPAAPEDSAPEGVQRKTQSGHGEIRERFGDRRKAPLSALRPQRGKKARKKSRDEYHRVRLIAIVGIMVILVGTIASMIAANVLNFELFNLPRQAVAGVITPVQNVFSKATESVVAYLRKLKLRSNIEYEYEQLLAQVDDLVYKAMLADEYKHQLAQLQNLQEDMEANAELDPVTATVIGRESGNYFSSFTINVGTNQGVEDYMAVIVPGALVGITYNVTETKAQVQSVISGEMSVSAMIESTRDEGTISGTLAIDGEPMCRMYYLSDDHLPRPGDTVITSGVGLEIPKGIPIGTVRESTRGLENNKQYIVVEPIADFQHIEYVMVLRYRPAAQAAQNRGTTAQTTFQPLATARPIPTIVLGNTNAFPGATEDPAASAAPGVSPEASLTATPDAQTETATPPPDMTADPNATPTPESYSYRAPVPEDATPSPTPTETPEPTSTPAPTFDVGQMTVERDD